MLDATALRPRAVQTLHAANACAGTCDADFVLAEVLPLICEGMHTCIAVLCTNTYVAKSPTLRRPRDAKSRGRTASAMPNLTPTHRVDAEAIDIRHASSPSPVAHISQDTFQLHRAKPHAQRGPAPALPAHMRSSSPSGRSASSSPYLQEPSPADSHSPFPSHQADQRYFDVCLHPTPFCSFFYLYCLLLALALDVDGDVFLGGMTPTETLVTHLRLRG